MKNKYIEKLKQLIVDFYKNDEVKIVLFGSRARGDNSIVSDVDIGVISKGTLDNRQLSVLKEKVEDLNIPYKIELVNLHEASAHFREKVLKEGIIWKDYG